MFPGPYRVQPFKRTQGRQGPSYLWRLFRDGFHVGYVTVDSGPGEAELTWLNEAEGADEQRFLFEEAKATGQIHGRNNGQDYWTIDAFAYELTLHHAGMMELCAACQANVVVQYDELLGSDTWLVLEGQVAPADLESLRDHFGKQAIFANEELDAWGPQPDYALFVDRLGESDGEYIERMAKERTEQERKEAVAARTRAEEAERRAQQREAHLRQQETAMRHESNFLPPVPLGDGWYSYNGRRINQAQYELVISAQQQAFARKRTVVVRQTVIPEPFLLHGRANHSYAACPDCQKDRPQRVQRLASPQRVRTSRVRRR